MLVNTGNLYHKKLLSALALISKNPRLEHIDICPASKSCCENQVIRDLKCFSNCKVLCKCGTLASRHSGKILFQTFENPQIQEYINIFIGFGPFLNHICNKSHSFPLYSFTPQINLNYFPWLIVFKKESF